MKVAHVYKDVYPPVAGGIEKHIDGIRRGMPDVESDVIVCSRSRLTSVHTVGTGVEVRVGELGRLLSTPLAPGFPGRLRSLRADVFHLHMPNPLGELSTLAALRGRPIVASYHADIVSQRRLNPVYLPLQRACLRRAGAVVVGSLSLLRTSPALAGMAERAEHVPYGVDLTRFDPERVNAEDREALRRRYGTPLVVALGRLVHYKGVDQLIAAASSLDASVVIAGGGPLEGHLRDLARSEPRVHLLGSVPEADLPLLLAAADLFVLPSVNRAESFGIATIEAQAMGVPAVVTDVGTGTVEAIAPGETGVVVPAGDPMALAGAISALLTDPDRRRTMGEAARRRVLAKHSQNDQVSRLKAIYGRVIASSG
ncbi:MAG: glycosyltransferase [Actinomycetota bacterium]|nr:glycosyltransferase [Actinomycetota bacterium]